MRIGENYTIPTQVITSVSPYDLEPDITYTVADLMAMEGGAPEQKNLLPSLLRPLLFIGAGLLAYTYLK